MSCRSVRMVSLWMSMLMRKPRVCTRWPLLRLFEGLTTLFVRNAQTALCHEGRGRFRLENCRESA